MNDPGPEDAAPRSDPPRTAEEIFGVARELDGDEREAFVRSACEGKPDLEREVRELLQRSDPADAFFGRLEGLVDPLRSRAGRELRGERDEDAAPTAREPGPPGPDLPSGTEVGAYRILERIGSGGMGTIYSARDPRLDRDVALKFLPPWLAADPRAAERFLHEARAAAALDHANICTIYEIGEAEDGRPFIAMALYRGETLRERLDRGPLRVEEAVDIAAAVARALAAAHARGIIHRDVKPGNVMLTEDGRVKLLDFGLARLEDAALTRPGLLRGTVSYMAPEQVRGEAAGPASDLWALGVVLYEMLAGRRPFTGGRDRVRFHAILHEEPRSLEELRPEVPEALARIVERLLRKDPDDRHGSAEELLAELVPSLDSPTPAPGPGAGEPPLSERWLKSLVFRLWAAAALVGLAATAVWGVHRARTPTLNPSRLAVLPFGVSGASDSSAYLRNSVPFLIAKQLAPDSATTVLDAADLDSVLPPSVRSSRDKPTWAEARKVARQVGAGRVVIGDIETLPGLLTVRATLYHVATGAAETPVSASDSSGRVLQAVDRLVGKLLTVDAGRTNDLASLRTDYLGALKLFLKGQAAYDQGRDDSALADFVAAARIDTGFAMAQLMAWQASGYKMGPAPFTYIDAWRHRSRLSARDKEYVELLVGSRGPAAYYSPQQLLERFRTLTQLQPTNPRAWREYGEQIPLGEAPEGIRDAKMFREDSVAFAEVLALDSTKLYARVKLFKAMMMLDDTAAAFGYLRPLLSDTATGLAAEWSRCVHGAFSAGAYGRPAMSEVLTRLDSATTPAKGGCLADIYNIATGRNYPKIASPLHQLSEHLLAEVPSDRPLLDNAYQVLLATEKDEGRITEAMQLEDLALRVGEIDTLGYLAGRVRDGLWWDGDTAAARSAALELGARLNRHRPRSANSPATDPYCVLGEWLLQHGDTARAAPIARQLRELGGDLKTYVQVYPLYCGRVLAAWIAAQRSASDAADSIARLAAPDAPRPNRWALVKDADRILSRLLEDEGQLRAAYDVFQRDRFTLQIYHVPTLKRKAHLTTLLGDTAAAIDYYRQYLTFRHYPEPALRPEVEKVRQSLARLEH